MNQEHADAIKRIVAENRNGRIFRRREITVDHPPQIFDRDGFWKQVVGCLLSTQQNVRPGTPVIRFLETVPFPLSLDACEQHEQELMNYAQSRLSAAGGIRFNKTIAGQVAKDFQWLKSGGWDEVKKAFWTLASIKRDAPAAECIAIERQAAQLVMGNMHGFGPKQSRNLWMCLGLTRYEIPIDGRVADWFNNKLSPPLGINMKKIGQPKYYECIESEIQTLCEEAGVLPCLLDAAVFGSLENKK